MRRCLRRRHLSCNECHGSTATQVNLKNMGYVLERLRNLLYAHSATNANRTPGFTSVHSRHVRGEGIDCSGATTSQGLRPSPAPTRQLHTQRHKIRNRKRNCDTAVLQESAAAAIVRKATRQTRRLPYRHQQPAVLSLQDGAAIRIVPTAW